MLSLHHFLCYTNIRTCFAWLGVLMITMKNVKHICLAFICVNVTW